MTPDELKAAMPQAQRGRCALFAEPLTWTMTAYEINTVDRKCMFIAQIAHESGHLWYTEELASGRAYEGRASLGNTEPGDGPLFKGHGLIQLTGRANHQKYADYKGMSIDQVLVYLQSAAGAADVSGWFWKTNHINTMCDMGDFRGVCAVINTGRSTAPIASINGYAERLLAWRQAQAAIKK